MISPLNGALRGQEPLCSYFSYTFAAQMKPEHFIALPTKDTG